MDFPICSFDLASPWITFVWDSRLKIHLLSDTGLNLESGEKEVEFLYWPTWLPHQISGINKKNQEEIKKIQEGIKKFQKKIKKFRKK